MYAHKMGVSKQYISKWVKEGKLEAEWSEELGRNCVVDSINNRAFFMNPHPTRGGTPPPIKQLKV